MHACLVCAACSLIITSVTSIDGSCRARVVLVLAKKFASPKDAITSMTEQTNVQSTPASSLSSIPIIKEELLMNSFLLLSSDEQLVLVSDMFKHIASNQYSLNAPDDFVEMSLKGMQKLLSDGKSNVIYGLCNGFGRSRPENENESYFPTSRMPMGLLEYMVNFFITEHGNKVSTVIVISHHSV